MIWNALPFSDLCRTQKCVLLKALQAILMQLKFDTGLERGEHIAQLESIIKWLCANPNSADLEQVIYIL